jgi:hypothetical protein
MSHSINIFVKIDITPVQNDNISAVQMKMPPGLASRGGIFWDGA